MRLTGSYSPLLVFLSVVVASAASYTALDLAGRLSSVTGRARVAWLLGGSLALGVGIWSMHFVGMLAFHLPIPVTYGVEFVVLSMLVAISENGCAARLRGAGLEQAADRAAQGAADAVAGRGARSAKAPANAASRLPNNADRGIAARTRMTTPSLSLIRPPGALETTRPAFEPASTMKL